MALCLVVLCLLRKTNNMKKIVLLILIIILQYLSLMQTNVFAEDVLNTTDSVFDTTDAVLRTTEEVKQKTEKPIYAPLSKSVSKALVGGLLFPGIGQIYTHSYIKAPIFGIVAGGLWYLTFSNNSQANNFRRQLDLIEDKNSVSAMLLRNKRETAIDNRDMSILCLVGVYVISLVDAYASVHLFDFNVSNSNSLLNNSNSVFNNGLGISITPLYSPLGHIFLSYGIKYRF